MENRSTAIEFKTIPFHSDVEDLSQECTAYMKTKQFMAKRIHQQQEEIEMLKQAVIFHSGKHIQMMEMLRNMNEQMELIKQSVKPKSEKVEKKDNLDFSNEELASSFVYEDNFEMTKKNVKPCESPLSVPYNKTSHNEELREIRNENVELRKELEKLRIDILDKSIEMNKVKTDKFILFNELNELVQSLRRTDLEKLNTYYKKNIISSVSKFEMPTAKGIKYNILSAQSQLSKILHTDSINKKLNKQEIPINFDLNEKPFEKETIEKQQMDYFSNILKSTEEEFDNLLDRKLAKRSKSYYYY